MSSACCFHSASSSIESFAGAACTTNCSSFGPCAVCETAAESGRMMAVEKVAFRRRTTTVTLPEKLKEAVEVETPVPA